MLFCQGFYCHFKRFTCTLSITNLLHKKTFSTEHIIFNKSGHIIRAYILFTFFRFYYMASYFLRAFIFVKCFKFFPYLKCLHLFTYLTLLHVFSQMPNNEGKARGTLKDFFIFCDHCKTH